MREKWERQPQRIGLVVGFVLLPLLWWLQEKWLFPTVGFRSPSYPSLLPYLVAGAIPGAILGAGLSEAAVAARRENWRAVKWILLRHGVIVLTLILLMQGQFIWQLSQISLIPTYLLGFRVPSQFGFPIVLLLCNMPLQVALLMLFIGLLMRSRR